MVRSHTTFSSCSTARTWRPAMLRAARLCSTPARPVASCVQTSSSSTAARERAAVQPPRPARPPLPALPPRPARGAGAALPAWAAWTPRSRWYSCPAAGHNPPPHAGRARLHRVDRWTDAPTHLSSLHPAPREHFLSPRGHSPARLPGDTNSPPSPQRGMETLAHAPTTLLPYLDCPGSTCWMFVDGHSLAAVWALGCLDFAGSCPLGAGKRSSPACVLQSGGGSRNPGWLLGQRHARGRG